MEPASSPKRKPSYSRGRRRFQRPPPGSVPGTVTPHDSAGNTTIQALSFSEDKVEEVIITDPEEIRELVDTHAVTWISIIGLKNIEIIHRVADIFGLHSLALEDAFTSHQRPKAEPYDQHLYIVANILQSDPESYFRSQQISIFVGNKFVVTFRDETSNCLEPVRERIKRQMGKLRIQTSDYLAYSIIDTIIDHYFPIAEHFAAVIDEYEDVVLKETSSAVIKHIYEFKSRMDAMYQVIWNHKELINFIIRHEEQVIAEETKIYLRDCHDHTMQLLEFLRASREAAADLVRLHLNLDTQRSNDIMKFLTLISSLFLPLMFITGVYGMNFNTEVSVLNMPELNWALGYPFSLLLMLSSTIFLLSYFRFKGWISFRSIWRPRASTQRPKFERIGKPL